MKGLFKFIPRLNILPSSKTPRLDLYFSNSELTTLSLLNVACLGYICKSDDEYCCLKFTPRPLSHPLNPFRDGDDKKRPTERGARLSAEEEMKLEDVLYRYGGEEAIKLSGKLMPHHVLNAYKELINIHQERGESLTP